MPSNKRLSDSGHFYNTDVYQINSRNGRCSLLAFETGVIDNCKIRSSFLNLSEQATIRAQILNLIDTCNRVCRMVKLCVSRKHPLKNENAAHVFSRPKIFGIGLNCGQKPSGPRLKIDVQVYGGKIEPSPSYSDLKRCPFPGNTLPPHPPVQHVRSERLCT